MTSQPEEVDLRTYLKVLKRRWGWIVVVCGAILILTGIITFTSTPVYQATTDIMIKPSSGGQGLSSVLSELDFLAGVGKRSDMEDQLHLISSRPTLVRAQELLRGTQTDGGDGSDTAAASDTRAVPTVDEIGSATRVTQLGGNIISISAESTSPTQAAGMADSVAKAFQELDRERSLSTLSSVESFLSDQMDTVKNTLNASEEEIVAYQQKNGILLEQSLMTAEVGRIEQLLVEAKVDLGDDQMKLDSIDKFLENVKSEFLSDLTSQDKGTPVLLEMQDKISFLLKLQKEITQLENERSQYLEAGNYAQAKVREQDIIEKRKKLQDSATEQYKVLDALPQYEDLIKTQLDTTLEIEAVKNRVNTLEQMKGEKVGILLDKGLSLARLQAQLDITQKIYDVLLEEYQKAQIAKAAQLGNVEIVSAAEIPTSPIKPKKTMNLLVGVVLGLFGGVGAGFVREFLDNTIHSQDEVEQLLGVTALGSIPRLIHPVAQKWRFQEVEGDLLPNLRTNPVGYQAFVNVATNLRFVSPDKPLQTMVVTSSLPDEGKSTVAANLSMSLALNGKRVLLLDADFRRPVLERVFNLKENGKGGLAEFILGSSAAEDATQEIARDGSPVINFMPAGKAVPNPTELLSSERFTVALAQLREIYDHIIIDSPPLSVAVDASILASKSDGTILVVEANKTRKEDLLRSRRSLEHVGINLVGVILNKVHRSAHSYYGGYYYKYYNKESVIPTRRGRVRKLLGMGKRLMKRGGRAVIGRK